MKIPRAFPRWGLGSAFHVSNLPSGTTSIVISLSLLAGTAVQLPAAPDLLSPRLESVVPGAGGNGNSVSPLVTPDGRFVVFSSSANNLVTDDNSYMGLDVFLRDQVNQTTELVSSNITANGGGNDHSVGLAVSPTGRYVLFQSDATDLLPGDTNNTSDVFLRDRQLGTTLLISVAAGGGWGNGASTEAVMSTDGQWIAFVSTATNLVSGDTNGVADLFLRHVSGGTTQRITAGGTGANSHASAPLITPDGRYTAFFSTARNLAPGVPTTTRGEIYLYDALANSVSWVSTNASATTSNLLKLNQPPSYHPALSEDGRYIAFKCGWTNGTVTPPTPGVAAALVFRHDASAGTTTIISTNAFPAWPFNDDVYGPEMSPDGRFIAYVEREINGGAIYSSVRLWDQQTGTNVLVSGDANGLWPANSISHTPTVSADGRFVTFLSDATTLVTNVVATGLHLYRRDLQTATTVLVDADPNGAGVAEQTYTRAHPSADGRFIVYSSEDGLFESDTNNALDVVLWDATTRTNQLISTHNPMATSQSGNGLSVVGPLSVSGDGKWIAFASFAPDLVANDFNRDIDVFVRDQWTDHTILVSVGLDGNAATGGSSHSPVISGDGRYVFFLSGATNLVANDTNQAIDLFRRDLWSGSTVRASVNSSGVALGTGDSSAPACSPDGRYVVFHCRTNTTSSSGAIFWRDMQLGQTQQVGAVGTDTFAPTLSANGQRVAYATAFMFVWDAVSQSSTNLGSIVGLRSAAIAPGGDKILFATTAQLSVRNLAFTTNQVLASNPQQLRASGHWSGDGCFAAFVTRSNLLLADLNSTNDVYLHDFQTGTFILVSRAPAGPGSADGPSDWPYISADGNYVAFRSFATNIAPGIVRAPSLLVFNRLAGTNSLIVTSTTGIGPSAWITQPALSAAGGLLAFQSWDEGLISGDRNRFGDSFASGLPATPGDSDGDGIPDWWTMQYFGHPTGQAGDLSRADDDADGDGLTNAEEFRSGTIPTSASSLLALQITAVTAGNNVALTWEAAPGKAYQVLATTNLINPVWEVLPGSIGVVNRQASFVTPVSGEERYFRVECSD
jgi:Tol biopolymer transport system component